MVLAGELPAARLAKASTKLALRWTVPQHVEVNRAGANADKANPRAGRIVEYYDELAGRSYRVLMRVLAVLLGFLRSCCSERG
jgi:hypothetical protein